MSITVRLEKILIEDTVNYRIVNKNDISRDLFTIVTHYNENGEYVPVAVIVFSSMVDNGDYNYEDEYEPNYCEEFSYRKISYSPITGDKIIFFIEKEVDETLRYNHSQCIIEKYGRRKRLSLKEKEMFSNAKDVIKEITKGFIPIVEDVS